MPQRPSVTSSTRACDSPAGSNAATGRLSTCRSSSAGTQVKEHVFAWEGRDKTGKIVRGEMRAGGETIVNVTLRRQGIMVTKVKKKVYRSGKKIKDKDLTLFTRQLATMMKAGVPLLQSFDIVGKGHANLLHHFGSAAGLQSALAADIVNRVTRDIADVVARARRGEADAREIVERTFDAFDAQGAGALASWMILTGNTDALRPITAAIHDLVDQLGAGHADTPLHEMTLSLVLTALGDSLLGSPLAEALGLPRDAARTLARRQLLGHAGLAETPSVT